MGTFSQGDCSPVQGILLVLATLFFVVSQIPLALVTYKGMKSERKKAPTSKRKRLSPGELALLAFLPVIGLLILIALPYTRRQQPEPADGAAVEMYPVWPNVVMLYSDYKKLADPQFKAAMGMSWLFPYEPVVTTLSVSDYAARPVSFNKILKEAEKRAEARKKKKEDEEKRFQERAVVSRGAARECGAKTATGGRCQRLIAPGNTSCGSSHR